MPRVTQRKLYFVEGRSSGFTWFTFMRHWEARRAGNVSFRSEIISFWQNTRWLVKDRIYAAATVNKENRERRGERERERDAPMEFVTRGIRIFRQTIARVANDEIVRISLVEIFPTWWRITWCGETRLCKFLSSIARTCPLSLLLQGEGATCSTIRNYRTSEY